MVPARAFLERVQGGTVVFLSLWEPAALFRHPGRFHAAAAHFQMDKRNPQVGCRSELVDRASIATCRQEEACALRALRDDGQSQHLHAVSIRLPTSSHIMNLPGQGVFAGGGHRFDTHRSVATSALSTICSGIHPSALRSVCKYNGSGTMGLGACSEIGGFSIGDRIQYVDGALAM